MNQKNSDSTKYSVCVYGNRGGMVSPPHYFTDNTEARHYYAEMVVKYPEYNVEFSTITK